MWNSVVYDEKENGPCSRSKHSVTLLQNQLYMLAGRNGNIPLKDFWRFDLTTNKWELLKPNGDCPPSLQEHTAVPFRDNIYVFGGELGFSAGSETPLWVYESKKNSWRKMRGQKGASVPKGRRGHTTLVHRGSALIYGGYCDLRGSSNEFWIFHFDTESWHLLMNSKTGPPARHKHSSVLHDNNMWIYGGMTDLQERSDLWRFDLTTKTWFAVKCKFSPGHLHSHAACKLPSSMLLFGGERNGQLINELWRFHFGTETWQRIQTDVILPPPISECCALTISELLLQNEAAADLEVNTPSNYLSDIRREYLCSGKMIDEAVESSNGNENGNAVGIYCGDCYQNNGGSGGENSFSHSPSYILSTNGESGGGVTGAGIMIPPRRQATTPNSCNLSFLKEISKMNLSRLTQSTRCSYHALDSVESTKYVETAATTRAEFNSSMVCSGGVGGSALRDVSSMVDIPLAPSDDAKLVYLEGAEAAVLGIDEFSVVHQQLHPSQNQNRRSFPSTNTVRFASPLVTPEQPSPDITSGYASYENIHKLLSSDNSLQQLISYGGNDDQVKTPPHKNISSVISFSNPNYLTDALASTPSTTDTTHSLVTFVQQLQQPQQLQMGRVQEKISRREYVKLNNLAGSSLEKSASSFDNKYEMTELRPKPPKSLPLRCGSAVAANEDSVADMPVEERKKFRTCNAARYEDQSITSLCVFLIGGKDHCQVTTFKRPISIWRLSLTEDIY